MDGFSDYEDYEMSEDDVETVSDEFIVQLQKENEQRLIFFPLIYY